MAAFETPVRRRATERRGSGRGSSLLGAESELTPGGAQTLHGGLPRSGRALALQVLGVYRYVADPALRRALPPSVADALEWDVFDLVLSDGQKKVKALLSPALNHLVWRGLVSEWGVVEIDAYELLSVPLTEQDADDDASHAEQPTRDVCIIHDLTPRAPAVASAGDDAASASQATMTPRAKIVYSVGNALLASPSTGAVPDLQFVSEAHIREYGALPLAGTRLYYMSLFSDEYPADWEPDQREALAPASLAVPWTEWNRRRRYCTDIFTSTDRTVHTIQEVNKMTKPKKRTASEMEDDSDELLASPPPPPMIGVVRFKSGLVHVGSPNVANPFPFMFHIVLSDRDRSVEVAFFGSMAAKNFLVVQEGDLIQLQGFTVSRDVQPRAGGKKPRKLFVFPHMSTGIVSHVPDKYWALLETMKVLEKRPRKPRQSARNDVGEHSSTNHSSVWIAPSFFTTAKMQQPVLFPVDEGEEEIDMEDTYFDFVGVVTYVSRMHRVRPQRDASNQNTVEYVRAYRWIKIIDNTSNSEIVVRLYVQSQPTGFNAIQAGDVAMLSKLQWIRSRKNDVGLDFASSSAYTTIRLNDDVEPFKVFIECSDVFTFAKNLRASDGAKPVFSPVESSLVVTTESFLEGPSVEGYKPLYNAVSMSDSVVESLSLLGAENTANAESASHWTPAFNPTLSSPGTGPTIGIGYNYPFDEVRAITESMDALSHRYIRVHAALHDIRVAPSTTIDTTPEIEFLLTDGVDQDKPLQPIRLRTNILFKQAELPSPLDEMVASEAESLARLLSPIAVTSLNTASILRSTELPQFSPAKTSVASVESEQQEITLDTVKEHILQNRNGAGPGEVGGIDIALHLYRLPHGEVDLWIDSISI